MLKKNLQRILIVRFKHQLYFIVVLCFIQIVSEVNCCSPGRSGARRRSTRKLTPLVFKQHVPNVPEHSFGASGPPEGRIWRDDERFKTLVPNYNTDIVFKDEEGTGVDRLMTRRCKEKVDILAISVMNMWPGVRLRVTEGFDEDGHHPKNSLHYEGRAVAISTSDRDTSKYGMLARLAVDAGFDWVFYESRSHIYCSVKTESTVPSRFSGCFHGSSNVITKDGLKPLSEIHVGDEVLSTWDKHVATFNRVVGFLHTDPHHLTAFIHIHTSSNNSLLITKDHLIFKSDKAVKAEDINIGDFVLVTNDTRTFIMAEVTSIRHVNMSGVYAPLTEAGTIVIDGVLNSCYAVINSHDIAHLAFLPLRLFYKIINFIPSSIYEMFTSDFISSLSSSSSSTFFSIEKNLPHTNDNQSKIHWYARFLCELSGIFVKVCT